MIDMHSHILFGADDGAKTVEDSKQLINEELSKGVRHIILTPHYKKKSGGMNKEGLSESFNVLTEYVQNEKLNIKLHMGNEIFFDDDFYDILNERGFYTLAGSDYILIEFSTVNTPKNIAEICYEIKIRGFVPIIAHVERYSLLYDNNELLEDILNEGAHLQVNASAVLNRESRNSNKFTNFLLKRELVSFVASDVHNMDTRRFYLDEAYRHVTKSYGTAYADKIFYLNQNKVLSNEYFDTPKIKSSRGRILSKLFRNKF